MKLFENYINGISKVLNKQPATTGNTKTVNSFKELMGEIVKEAIAQSGVRNMSEGTQLSTIEQNSKQLFNFDKSAIEKYFGKNRASFPNISIGPHPDFAQLQFDQMERHHCVSMFVDIKGSTRLALNHSLEDVRLIKDSLLTLCIHVANCFGGHVHRLQGDAAFIQFVRRGLSPNDSIINALNAATILCQFVSNDLSTIFQQKDLNPIKIRVGIDYGPDEEVIWSYYGIPGCHELTTTSLHTDLAAKLQARAANNSIRIGKNVVTTLDLPSAFYASPTQLVNGVLETKYYILQAPGFNYNQYDFDWEKYLNSFDFMRKNANGSLEIVDNRFTIKCETLESNGTLTYYQNSRALPKQTPIRYELLRDGLPYNRVNTEEIIWEVFNSGAEAAAKNDLRHDFKGAFKNKNYCEANAAYLGHHYLKCTIRRFSENVVVKFPIFVQ